MRIFILNYCILMGMLLFLVGLYWMIHLMNSNEWILVSLLIFVGVPVLTSWIIILERHRDQIRKEQENKKS